jgi:hypothetical protein
MDIGELALQGQVEWFHRLAACGCSQLTVRDGFAVSSGLDSNTENGAVVSPAILGPPGQLDHLLTWLRHRGLPCSIIVTEALDANDVAQFTNRGLVAENAGNEMGRSLRTGTSPPA